MVEAIRTHPLLAGVGQGMPPGTPIAPIDEFLDPNTPQGRIIILLSPDRSTFATPRRDNISLREAVKLMVEATDVLLTQLLTTEIPDGQ